MLVAFHAVIAVGGVLLFVLTSRTLRRRRHDRCSRGLSASAHLHRRRRRIVVIIAIVIVVVIVVIVVVIGVGSRRSGHVAQVWIRIVFRRQSLFTAPGAGRQQFPFFGVPPFHSAVLEPYFHLWPRATRKLKRHYYIKFYII